MLKVVGNEAVQDEVDGRHGAAVRPRVIAIRALTHDVRRELQPA